MDTTTSGYAAASIQRIELYLMFSTDCDFHADLDGLESFIRSHLGDDVLIYDFRAEVIPIKDYEDLQLVKLSVELPIYAHDLQEGFIPNSNAFFHRASWAENAITDVLLPAYLWIFAEIGVGNSHGVSSYVTTNIFDHFDDGTMVPLRHWLKSEFTDGVRLLPRMNIMFGNYEDSWAQWRFILDDAKDYGDPTDYIKVLKENLILNQIPNIQTFCK